MDSLTILIYIFGAIVGWIIFYYITKAAVRNGIKEVFAGKETINFAAGSTREKPANDVQRRLQQQYDKGEISFEEFKSQWNQLGS